MFIVVTWRTKLKESMQFQWSVVVIIEMLQLDDLGCVEMRKKEGTCFGLIFFLNLLAICYVDLFSLTIS